MKCLTTVLAVGLSLLLAGQTHAGFLFDENIQASIQTKHVYEADVESQPGEVATTETNASFRQEFKWGRVPMDWTLGYKNIYIEDSGLGVQLPTNLEGYSYSVGAKFPAPFMDSNNKFIGIDVGITYNTEDGDFDSSSARFPVRSYFIHKWNEKFLWIAGAGFTADNDDEWQPLVGFQYKPNDQLSFNFVSNNPNIAYKVDEKWTLMLEGSIDSDEFEVKRGVNDNVILKYDSYTAGVGVKYNMSENISAKLSVGGAFGRNFEYEDGQGKAVLDDALYTSFKLSAKF